MHSKGFYIPMIVGLAIMGSLLIAALVVSVWDLLNI